MLSYYVKCREKTDSKSSSVVKTKNGRIMFLSKYMVCIGNKLRFLKK